MLLRRRGDLDLATEDGASILDDAAVTRDVDVDDRLFAYRRQRVACCFGQLPGSAAPFRAPPPAVWSDVEQVIRDSQARRYRGTAHFTNSRARDERCRECAGAFH